MTKIKHDPLACEACRESAEFTIAFIEQLEAQLQRGHPMPEQTIAYLAEYNRLRTVMFLTRALVEYALQVHHLPARVIAGLITKELGNALGLTVKWTDETPAVSPEEAAQWAKGPDGVQ